MSEKSQPAHLTETWHIFNRVKELRQSSGLSRKDLAKELGLNHRTVGYIENQDYEFSLRLAWRMADYFGVELDDVVYRGEKGRDPKCSD